MDLLIICIAGFFAAFVDSIVGGGGMISIPALLATGMPTHLALGTNKFAASSGAISSVYHYYKGKNLNKEILFPLIPFSILGSAIGVICVLAINPDFLKNIIVLLIVIMLIYSFVNKNLGLEDHYSGMTIKDEAKSRGFTSIIGFYDGFFGPGTGSFFIMMLIHIFKFDFKRSAGNAKALNLASNVAALLMFLFNKQIAFQIGIPMAISMMLGARFGTLFALKKGTHWIKPIFGIVSVALIFKMVLT